jgi:transcriptional regulator with XRE-family HTH domain
MTQRWRVVKRTTTIANMTTSKLAGTPEGVVAARVRQLRDEQGFTLEALAQECFLVGYPLSRDVLHSIEQGRRRVNVNDMIALARVFEVSPLVLLLPDERATPVTLTEGRTSPALGVYEWLMGLRPSPRRFPVDDKVQARTWLRLLRYLPYAYRVTGSPKADFNEDEVAEMLRENTKGGN